MAKRFGLTKKQYACFDFIKSYLAKNKLSPSYAEIKEAIGLKSKNSIHHYIKQLVVRGWITKLEGRARSIRITKGRKNRFD